MTKPFEVNFDLTITPPRLRSLFPYAIIAKYFSLIEKDFANATRWRAFQKYRDLQLFDIVVYYFDNFICYKMKSSVVAYS